MNKLKLEIRGEEPRDYNGKTSYHALADEEREAFAGERRDALIESDPSDVQKQVFMLKGAFSPGLSLAAAFERYVNRDPRWYR